MSVLVDAVRGKVSEECCASRLRRGKCRVSIPEHIEQFCLIDMDHPEAPIGREGKRCDFLFVGSNGNLVAPNGNLVVPLEFKRGSPKVRIVLEQLQAGAQVADELIPKNMKDITFRPAVVYGGHMRRCQIRTIRNERISFRNTSHIAKLIKCGQSLAQVFKTK